MRAKDDPVKISIDTERNTFTLDEIEISLDVLREMVNPDSEAFFQFRRDHNQVIVTKRYELEHMTAKQ